MDKQQKKEMMMIDVAIPSDHTKKKAEKHQEVNEKVNKM